MKKLLKSFVSSAVYREEKECKAFSGNGTGRPSKYENQISWEKLHFIMHVFLEIEWWAWNNAL